MLGSGHFGQQHRQLLLTRTARARPVQQDHELVVLPARMFAVGAQEAAQRPGAERRPGEVHECNRTHLVGVPDSPVIELLIRLSSHSPDLTGGRPALACLPQAKPDSSRLRSKLPRA